MLQAKWKKLSILTTISFLLMGASQCQVGNAPPFNWSPDIYIGDARTQSVVRKDAGKVVIIKCSDAKFDDMVAMHNSEIAKAKQAYFDVVNQCDHWKSEAAAAAVDTQSAHLVDISEQIEQLRTEVHGQ